MSDVIGRSSVFVEKQPNEIDINLYLRSTIKGKDIDQWSRKKSDSLLSMRDYEEKTSSMVTLS